MVRLVLLGTAFAVLVLGSVERSVGATSCVPTRADALGPFYEPNAPVRSKVGSGYILSGRVLAARTCRPVARARIEFWLANPEGVYDDVHRATVIAGRDGRYRFESNRPVPYAGRPPHIHIRLSARGFRTLVTQHYPRQGRATAVFNLVLRRS
jgi:protocatechuate 3,4-dioxygenase beta subunit